MTEDEADERLRFMQELFDKSLAELKAALEIKGAEGEVGDRRWKLLKSSQFYQRAAFVEAYIAMFKEQHPETSDDIARQLVEECMEEAFAELDAKRGRLVPQGGRA
jgi:hypothetical protein